MQIKKKEIYKTLLFWEVLIGLLVMLCVLIVIVVELRKPLTAGELFSPLVTR